LSSTQLLQSKPQKFGLKASFMLLLIGLRLTHWLEMSSLAGKVRWATQGRGKSGGARVIYFNYSEEGVLELFAIYAKSERDSMTATEINQNRKV
jgi:hypothetical protein